MYLPFLDRLENGSLLSEEFKLGGEMSSVFARDLTGMDKDETDLLAKRKFSARVSYVSFFVRSSKHTDTLKVCSLALRGPERLRHVHASLETPVVLVFPVSAPNPETIPPLLAFGVVPAR